MQLLLFVLVFISLIPITYALAIIGFIIYIIDSYFLCNCFYLFYYFFHRFLFLVQLLLFVLLFISLILISNAITIICPIIDFIDFLLLIHLPLFVLLFLSLNVYDILNYK